MHIDLRLDTCVQVVNFPAFIVCDDKGNDFFAEFGM
jgi:tartrate dehydratase beta subunit/fumarate hydratase class I family protein